MNCGPSRLAEMLDHTQWASEFSWNQLQKIAKYLQGWEARQGTVIFREGDVDPSMSILVRGSVEIIKASASQHPRTIATLHAPESLGEMCLIDGEPRSAEARAARDVVMLVLTKDGFFELAKYTPLLAVRLLWKISGMISKRLRMTSGQFVDLQNSQDRQTKKAGD